MNVKSVCMIVEEGLLGEWCLVFKKADGKEGIIIAARVDYQCTDGITSFGDPLG